MFKWYGFGRSGRILTCLQLIYKQDCIFIKLNNYPPYLQKTIPFYFVKPPLKSANCLSPPFEAIPPM